MICRPFMRVTLLYGAGVLLAYLAPLSPSGLWLAMVGVALAALVPGRGRRWWLGFLVGLGGAANLTWRMALFAPDDLRALLGETEVLVAVRGRLRETPFQRTFELNGQESYRTLAVIEVHELRRKGQWESARGRVSVSTPGILGRCFYAGQSVEIYGLLQPPPGPAAEGLFDYQTYLRWQGIYYQLKTAGAEDWGLRAEAGLDHREPWSDRFCHWAQQTLGRGLGGEDEALRLIWAMALGWKTALTPEVTLPFMRTGTMHIFAISGLHIALIAGILVSVLRVVQVSRRFCGIIVIPLIWGYTAATGWQASAIRSTVMMTIVIVGWALRRPGDLLNSLMAAAFLLLLWDPRQLFQASFQLSFCVVLSLALLTPRFDGWRQRWLEPDPLVPASLRPRWQRWLDNPRFYLATGLATSIAAWLGSFPLVAWYFHLATPVGLLANLIVVPLSSLALMCHLGSLACGSWFPWITELFNHSGWLWMKLMILICQWAAELPGAYWHVRAPTPVGFLLYYSLLFGILAGWFWRPKLRFWVLGVTFFLGAAWLCEQIVQSQNSQLVVLSLGGGDALWADLPGRNQDLLVDAGNESSARRVVIPFLQSRGVNQLKQFLVTHGDIRHVGGADALVQTFPVASRFASGIPGRSATYRQLMKAWSDGHSGVRWLHRGDTVGLWRILHPDRGDRFSLADDNAIVLLGTVRGTRVLMLSDLGRQGQSRLLEREPDLRADIVIAGLPSQGEPLMDSLLQCLKPQMVILSTGSRHGGEVMKPALRKRLSASATPLVCTGDAGTVTLTFLRQGWRLDSVKTRRD